MKERRLFLYNGVDGAVYVSFEREENPKLTALDPLLPAALQGKTYEKAVKSQTIAQFFDLADMVLCTADSWEQHVKSLDMAGVTKDNPLKTRLPHFDLDFLNLRAPSGGLHPKKITEILSIVVAYWENPKDMAISVGYVAQAWHQGMPAKDIIKFIRDNTRKHPKTGEAELVFPDATPEEKLISALLPLDVPIKNVTKLMLEKLAEWLSSVPRGHAIFEIPQRKVTDVAFLGLVDASGKVDTAATDAARDYIWERIDQTPNFPALWRHIQASRGLLRGEDSHADYSAYNLHLAELADNGTYGLAIVEAILALSKTDMIVPSEPLCAAAKICWELDRAKDNRRSLEDNLKQQPLDLGRWLALDKVTNFTREAQKIIASRAPEAELESYLETVLSKAASQKTLRDYKSFYQKLAKAGTLQDLGVVDKHGQWSEVGFQRQQVLMREATEKGIPPSLEWLRWALHCRYRTEEPVPFVWALQKDRLPTKTVQRARCLANMVLSGGMTGKKFQIDEVITAEQFQLLWKFGAWLSDDVTVYLNYEYPDLGWLANYAEHPRLRLEGWQEICSFVYGKLYQDPDPTLLHDRLRKMGIIAPDWKEGDHQQSTSKPFDQAEKVGRNDPCPCGSGKKYKKCCGRA